MKQLQTKKITILQTFLKKKNNVGKETFVGGSEYILSRLELQLKEDNIQYNKMGRLQINEISNLINDIKKKNLSNINVNINETVTYKYTNTKTKQLDSISFQNFQKLYDENKLTWKTPDNHFVFDVKKITIKDRDFNYQIIKKKFNQRDFLYLLSLASTFYTKVGCKVYQSIDKLPRSAENKFKQLITRCIIFRL